MAPHELELIHYGSPRFHPAYFDPIRNDWVKPRGGLWTSPVSSDYGWEKWVTDNDYGAGIADLSESFRLKLSPTAKVCIIDSLADLVKLPVSGHPFGPYLDFERITQDYDAIWLTEAGQWKTRLTHPMNLYGWDVETVLILKPEAIILI